MADEIVSGLYVREHIPNMSSIHASFYDYVILDGVRKIPMSLFDAPAEVTERTNELADEIEESGEINPLIVAFDDEGAYILEGGHRYDALRILGIPFFPAKVVVELN